MKNECPNCQSNNVFVGSFVLECLDCKWHYLNKYPCSVCGNPSRSGLGVNESSVYRCADHRMTDDERYEFFAKNSPFMVGHAD